MQIVVTGHRPQSLGGFKQKNKFKRIKEAARKHFRLTKPALVTTGMALGWDQLVAEVCVEEKIPFIAALPCEGQEIRWPPKSQQHYQWLLSKAAQVVYVDREEGYMSDKVAPGVYHPAKMHVRNQWMINTMNEGDELFSLWNSSQHSGGTYACIEYFKQYNDGLHIASKLDHVNLLPSSFDDQPF